MDRFRNKKLTNLIFVLIVCVCHLTHSYIIFRDVGLYDWNFQNTLPVANVSPFILCLTPLIFLFPKKIRKYFFLLVSLLGVGMILSPTIGCVHETVINYKFHPHFLLDYTAHTALFLWGVYLNRSEQIEIDIKSGLLSASIIFGVAMIMMILNVIFDKAYFGLSLNGKHSIYNQKIVDNSYLSALIYLSGLSLVLAAGYGLHKTIDRKMKKIR